MGVLDIFRPMRAYETAIQAAVTGLGDPSAYPIATPFGSSDLERVMFADLFGGAAAAPLGRSAAMALPPVSRARNLMCGTVSKFPLRNARRGVPLAEQAAWLSTITRLMKVWTVDDLIFYGWSCWWRENGADSFPTRVERVNQEDWELDDDLTVWVNGSKAGPREVIVIPGFHEGILTYGREALADARALYGIVRERLQNPVPMTELHQVSGPQLTDTERDEMLNHWRAARKVEGGGVGYTSEHIELKTHGADADSQLMIEARNASAVDQARLVGVHAGMVDATAPKASLNYETSTGRNQEFLDLDVDLYMGPITDRLSLDDVTPRGQHVVFDTSDFTAPAPSPTGPALED